MSRKRRVTPQRVQQFIRGKLKLKLRDDLRKYRIVKEADLECSCYYHLRRLTKGDDRWRILSRKHALGKYYIDMLILLEGRPRIAIEFKWRRERISRKDRRALGACLSRLKVDKAYFICCIPIAKSYDKLHKKRRGEKYRLHERIIGLDWSPEGTRLWEERRKRLKALSGDFE